MSDLLPPQSTATERAIAEATARLDAVPVPNDTLWTPDTCPEALLPWLAWAVSVDYWDPRWPVAVRRRVIAEAIDVHRQHGTLNGMRRAMAALGVEVMINEWWEFGGQPYTFRIVAEPTIDLLGDATLPILSGELRRQIRRVINIVKPARTHFDLTFLLAATAGIARAAAVQATVATEITTHPITFTHGTTLRVAPAAVQAQVRTDIETIWARYDYAETGAALPAAVIATLHTTLETEAIIHGT